MNLRRRDVFPKHHLEVLQGACQPNIRVVGCDSLPSGMWKFEVFKDPSDDGWRWRIVVRNTLIVFESERLARRGDAQQAAERARDEIGKAMVSFV